MASSPAAVLVQQAAAEKHVSEARKKLTAILDDEILDYKHGNPINIENCVTTLRRLMANVMEQPTNAKFRQVKAASNVFKNNISAQKGGEHFLMWAGWHTQVVELQKFWVFDGEAGSTKMKILSEAIAVLDRAMHTIHEKAERKRQEMEGRKQRILEERERVRLQIEEDKADRRLRNELTTHHESMPASPLGGSVGTTPAAPQRLPTSPGAVASTGGATPEQGNALHVGGHPLLRALEGQHRPAGGQDEQE